MSTRDSPGSHADLSGQELLGLAQVLRSQTEERHCTCISAIIILSLESPLKLEHKTTTDIKWVKTS